ncbi:Uncharacterized sensor-like histidine kinase ycf26 [Geodia barretti]|uniref:histidine kinase n=1 Tax=Geodia barretti TaxID=519541 RepID=A0AA35X2J7_GEOBA|nr:Uncharacterized sensor-like histidine kinase ycf26 [Geodia barretti]
MALVGGAAVASSAIVACLSVSRSSQSIREVTAGIDRIDAGDLDHRIRTDTSGDTGKLVAAFNRMATSLTSMMGDLSGERNKLSAVMETMSDGVIVVDSSGDVELLNGAAATLFGVDPGVDRDTPFSIGHDHELRQLVAACREAGEPQYAEIILTEGRRTVSAVATTAGRRAGRSRAGHPARPHGAAAGRDLAARVRQQRLARVEDAALVDQGDGGNARGRRPGRPQHQRRFRSTDHIEADRMTTLVNDLLELTSLQSGQADMKAQQVDIASVIREEGSRYVQVAEGLGIEARVSLPEDPCRRSSRRRTGCGRSFATCWTTP